MGMESANVSDRDCSHRCHKNSLHIKDLPPQYIVLSNGSQLRYLPIENDVVLNEASVKIKGDAASDEWG